MQTLPTRRFWGDFDLCWHSLQRQQCALVAQMRKCMVHGSKAMVVYNTRNMASLPNLCTSDLGQSALYLISLAGRYTMGSIQTSCGSGLHLQLGLDSFCTDCICCWQGFCGLHRALPTCLQRLVFRNTCLLSPLVVGCRFPGRVCPPA